MTGPEWGRAPRGRVWHLLSPVGGAHEAGAMHDVAICSVEHDIVDVVQGQPPRGARICTACELRVEQLGRAVAMVPRDDGRPEQ